LEVRRQKQNQEERITRIKCCVCIHRFFFDVCDGNFLQLFPMFSIVNGSLSVADQACSRRPPIGIAELSTNARSKEKPGADSRLFPAANAFGSAPAFAGQNGASKTAGG